MGEKERGALEEEQRQTQQASFGERAARPREAGAQRAGGGVMHEDTWTGQRLSAEDEDGGVAPDAAESAIVKSRSNVKNNREAGPDDGYDAPGEGGPLEATNLNSSRSNVYRTAGPDDGGGDAGFAINEPGVGREAGPDDGGGEAGLAIGDQGAVEEKKPRPK